MTVYFHRNGYTDKVSHAVEDGSASGSEYGQQLRVSTTLVSISTEEIHKYVRFAFNTECFNCPATVRVNHHGYRE